MKAPASEAFFWRMFFRRGGPWTTARGRTSVGTVITPYMYVETPLRRLRVPGQRYGVIRLPIPQTTRRTFHAIPAQPHYWRKPDGGRSIHGPSHPSKNLPKEAFPPSRHPILALASTRPAPCRRPNHTQEVSRRQLGPDPLNPSTSILASGQPTSSLYLYRPEHNLVSHSAPWPPLFPSPNDPQVPPVPTPVSRRPRTSLPSPTSDDGPPKRTQIASPASISPPPAPQPARKPRDVPRRRPWAANRPPKIEFSVARRFGWLDARRLRCQRTLRPVTGISSRHLRLRRAIRSPGIALARPTQPPRPRPADIPSPRGPPIDPEHFLDPDRETRRLVVTTACTARPMRD